MTPCDLLLAATLLTTPLGVPEQVPTPDRWPGVQAAIHKTAIEWEILDPRETGYVLARLEDFQTDLDILRKRYAELSDAPRVSDGGRFPDRNAVNENIRFNRAYRRNLEKRAVWESDRADLIRTVMVETDQLYAVWDAVRDARCEFYYVTVRRAALKKLRDLLGTESYDLTILPPIIPEWRFSTTR